MPAGITGDELDPQVRAELSSLPGPAAATAAQHLAAAGLLLDSEPEAAYEHARAARRLASRLGGVREATGLAAYATGRYAEALTELRAARRLTGSPDYLPILADCERGLGRPDRALALAGDPDARRLDRAGRAELRIVAAGARRDLGQLDAALVTLRGSDLLSGSGPETARVRYAYADALLAAGRAEEAASWFAQAAQADDAGNTDAVERLALIRGVNFLDSWDEAEDVDNVGDIDDPDGGTDLSVDQAPVAAD